ncbi:ABC transporter ATP-binding protein [Candidatus Persebacteraceae bacterium Df01]|jgi:ABC-2 type transport system ATP-binding protein|uniref:ABC transporter ATP-binding protein n=1 Tax=Candidatus Doriopsillibacter californiensis TaxID=2970740 RepID=A0ABT7QJC3_9GAMM|nr:ABC transporter ATP-binding protein [Candidatus Persebacteraceae bacterium Df01]
MLAVEVHNLTKSYYGTPVLRGINFSVEAGQSFGFAGINGAGKSTFLKCLLDFCHYESGDIRLFDVSSKNRHARARMAFLPERFIPPYYLTGEQFLRFMMKLQDTPFSHKQALEMLADLDLDDSALRKPVRSFSKGMTQKLGLASCFLAERDIYFLDEPMSGLDPKARVLVKRQFSKLAERGATLFFTSHMLADIEEVCSRMGVLHDGRICYLGTPAMMREQFGGNTLEEAYLAAINTNA